MQEQFVRTEMVLGAEKVAALATKTVAVFGLGGVGGHAVEALARCGVGHFVLVDNDVVAESNINRQLVATHDTVGMPKVEVMAARIHAINPDATVQLHRTFYLPEQADDFDWDTYDHVVDAIDTVSAKIDLAVRCLMHGVPLVAALGCGNRVDPTQLRVGDIYDTHRDPLAKVMRHELRRRGIPSLRVVYSVEQPLAPLFQPDEGETKRRSTPGSTPFVPAVAGIMLAQDVVMRLAAFDPATREE